MLSGCAVVLMLAVPARAEIIDRILAVVQGNVITLSDVHAALGLGLVDVSRSADPTGAIMERLIERALMLIEVDRYSPPEPSQEAIDARLAEVRRRFPSDAALEAALAGWGMTREQLRRQVHDDLLLSEYLHERFDAAIQPSEDEVREYYRQHQAGFSRGGVPRPFSEVSSEVRTALIAERRVPPIADWVTGLRRRADVNVLYLPAKG